MGSQTNSVASELSSPSLTLTPEPQATKRPSEQPFSPRPNKRPRFNKSNQGSRHSGTSYQKKAIPVSLGLFPRKSNFQIHFSMLGMLNLTSIVYRFIVGKEPRFNQVSLPLLQYAVSMTIFARVMNIASTIGYHFCDDVAKFKRICKGVKLPEILAQYVESLGVIDLPNGPRVVPYFMEWHDCLAQDYLTEVLEPFRQLNPNMPIPNWALRNETIVDYITLSSRGDRAGVGFRPVDFDELMGKKEFLVSTRPHGDGLIPCSPIQMTAIEAIQGAIYRWRDAEEMDRWLGPDNHLIQPDFEGSVVSPDTYTAGVLGERFPGAEKRF